MKPFKPAKCVCVQHRSRATLVNSLAQVLRECPPDVLVHVAKQIMGWKLGANAYMLENEDGEVWNERLYVEDE